EVEGVVVRSRPETLGFEQSATSDERLTAVGLGEVAVAAEVEAHAGRARREAPDRFLERRRPFRDEDRLGYRHAEEGVRVLLRLVALAVGLHHAADEHAGEILLRDPHQVTHLAPAVAGEQDLREATLTVITGAQLGGG